MLFAAGELGVAVVLAHEQDRQLPQHRQIQRLVKRARASRAVAEERDADVLSPRAWAAHAAPAASDRLPPTTPVAPSTPCRGIDQMHRAAATATHAGLATDDFRERRFDVAALREHVTMAAMAGEQHVVRTEVSTDAGSNSFLTGGQMGKAGHFAGRSQPLHLAFERTDAPERPQDIEQRLARRDRGIVQGRVLFWVEPGNGMPVRAATARLRVHRINTGVLFWPQDRPS